MHRATESLVRHTAGFLEVGDKKSFARSSKRQYMNRSELQSSCPCEVVIFVGQTAEHEDVTFGRPRAGMPCGAKIRELSASGCGLVELQVDYPLQIELRSSAMQ